MKIKKSIALLLSIITIFTIGSLPANAAVVTPQYEQISSVVSDLEVSGKTLSVSAATYGYFDATNCGVTATLQKLSGSSWTNYKVWSASSPSDYVIFGTTINVSSGQYRLVTSHSVSVGSSTEYEGMISPTRTVT